MSQIKLWVDVVQSPCMSAEREQPSQDESILAREFVETVLMAARENLEKDGHVLPVLFLQFASGDRDVYLLKELPDTTEEKQAYFTALELFVRGTRGGIREAVFVSEVWYVGLEDGRADPEVGVFCISPRKGIFQGIQGPY